jgi:hypothetical protein
MSELPVAEIIVIVVIVVLAVHRRNRLIRRLGTHRLKIVEVEIVCIVVIDRLRRLSSDWLSRCRFSRAWLAARPAIICRAATSTATASASAAAASFLAFAAATIVTLSGGARSGDVVDLVVVALVIISFENVVIIMIEHLAIMHIVDIIKVVAYDARTRFEIVVRLIGFVFASRAHGSRCFAAFAATTAAASATATSAATATRFVGRPFGALLRRATRVELFDKFGLDDDFIVALRIPRRRLDRSGWRAFGSTLGRTIFALPELARRTITRPTILRRPVT